MTATKKIIIACLALSLSACFASCAPKHDDFLDLIPDVKPGEVQHDEKEKKDEVKVEVSDEAEQKKESRKEINALADAAIEKMKAVPQYPAGYPTLDAVVEQYKKAAMAVGWIVNTEKIATDSNDTYEENGMTYQRVKPDCHYGEHELDHLEKEGKETEKLIYNKESFEAYLATLIHPEEASDYMLDLKEGYDVPRLVAGDNGALYALPFSYSPSGYGDEETYELTSNGDGSYTFTVNYTVVGNGGEKKTRKQMIDYVKVDGRWVFENFILYRQ